MFRLLALLFVLLTAFPATAQKRSPEYQVAAQAWSSLDRYERVRMQVLLAASGHWNSVPNQDFSQRLFEAITSFQRENGFEPTGYLPQPQINRTACSCHVGLKGSQASRSQCHYLGTTRHGPHVEQNSRGAGNS
jgi:hypothetical protein